MQRTTLAIVFLIVVIDLMGFGIVIPLLPLYADAYSPSPALFGLLMAVYSLMQLLFTPVLGRLSDRFGRRPILLLSLLGSVFGYLLFAFQGSFWILLLSRMVAGATGASVATAQAVIADVTPPKERARGMGLIGAAFGLGFILGPAMGGIAIRLGEAAPGLFAACFSAAALLITLWKLPETWPEEKRAERVTVRRGWFSLHRLREALARVSHQESQRNDEAARFSKENDRGRHRRSLCTTPKAADRVFRSDRILSLPKENRADPTLQPVSGGKSGLGHPRIGTLLVVTFLFIFALSMFESTFALFLDRRLSLEAIEVTIMFVYLGILAALVQGVFVGRLAQRFGERRLVIAGALLIIPGYLLFTQVFTNTAMVILLVPLAVGMGLTGPSLAALVSRGATDDEQGGILGVYQAVSSLGRIAGPFWGIYALERLGAAFPYLSGAAVMAVVLIVALAAFRRPDPTG